MIVEILDWEKFNPRADRANYSWFRFENKFFTKTFSWSGHDQRMFIYLCCVASQESRTKLSIDIELASALLKLSTKEISKSIQSLHDYGVLKTGASRHNDGVTPSDGVIEPALRLTTNVTNVTNERNVLADSANLHVSLDFESLYKKYPRKEGKQRGLKICKVQVKTIQEFHDLSGAINRYAEHVKKSGTDSRYIKHFSTFMGEWRDWLDSETGTIAEKEEPQWVQEAREKERLELEALKDAV